MYILIYAEIKTREISDNRVSYLEFSITTAIALGLALPICFKMASCLTLGLTGVASSLFRVGLPLFGNLNVRFVPILFWIFHRYGFIHFKFSLDASVTGIRFFFSVWSLRCAVSAFMLFPPISRSVILVYFLRNTTSCAEFSMRNISWYRLIWPAGNWMEIATTHYRRVLCTICDASSVHSQVRLSITNRSINF